MTSNSPTEPLPLPQAGAAVLVEHSRPVAHLRERFRAGRLGLLFGAGISRDLGFPNWPDLLSRIPQGFRIPFTFDPW